MKRVVINPPSLFDSTAFGFSQIVISSPGKLVFVSGQVAWDKDQNVIGVNDLGIQVHQSLDNLEVAMAAAGGQLGHIVMLRIYLVDYCRDKAPIISQALIDRFGADNLPASTWLHVKGLAREEFMVEIEAQAVI